LFYGFINLDGNADKINMRIFFQSFFQVGLVSISTILITKHLYFGIFILGFLISLLWSFNVSKIAVSTINKKITYSLGAGIGAVCGVLITNLFI
jgi:hypothetical protein